jgi:hypothetical protein
VFPHAEPGTRTPVRELTYIKGLRLRFVNVGSLLTLLL